MSVVMNVWNRATIVGDSIESILGQTYKNIELIIVDDGSTDNTKSVVEAFRDSRIRFFPRPHLGLVASANFGIAQAQGKYIARLDSDDLSSSDRIQEQVAALENDSSAVMCYTDFSVFGENAHDLKHGRFVRNSMLIALKMCFVCPLYHTTVMYRRDAINRVGGYLPATPVAEDYNLYTRLISEGPFIGLPKKLVSVRLHGTSATQQNLATMKQLTQEIAVNHAKSFFHFSETQARNNYANFNSPFNRRNLGLWVGFCFKILSFRKCWQLELLAWMASQSLRILFSKIAAIFSPKNSNAG